MTETKYRTLFKAVALMLATVLVAGTVFLNTTAKESKEDGGSYWMSELSDDLAISEISIPGTHDSGTKHITFGYFMRCQNTTIAKQLKAGFRYLDLRLAIDAKAEEPRLNIIHNFAKCHTSASPFSSYLYLEDVLEDVYDFLDENPTEAVILNMKIESDDSVSSVQKLLYEAIDENPQYWYTSDSIPTLGEVRGQIVLCTRFEDELKVGEGLTGIQLIWEDQGSDKIVDMPCELSLKNGVRYWGQDRYNYDAQDKFEAVTEGFENCETDSNTLFLNFVSTSGKSPIGHPKGYAKDLNKLVLNYEFNSSTCYGIVIVDYGSAKLAEKMYSTNF